MTQEETPLTVGVPKESFPGERRVALIPAAVTALEKAGCRVVVETGAGVSAGYPDAEYRDKGAEVAPDRASVFEAARVIAQVRAAGANPEQGGEDLGLAKPGQVFIGFCEPLGDPESVKTVAEKKVSLLSMELIPRITRAQSMDALSSMATVAGYRSVLLAAEALPRMFPMFMTAAGTVAPARVFVVGAGVAGLQAIAMARRLGAVVNAYDVRPVVKEQVESLGARFVELKLDAAQSEDKGGYAKAMDEEFYRKQREMMKQVLADSDVVITTAAVPGKKAPTLVTREMVKGMAPGSVIVDLAAERGGNCELTKPGETVVEEGVTILGPANMPSDVPYHASQMYSKNVSNLLTHLIKEGDGDIDLTRDDEIIQGTVVVRDGEIVHPMVREVLGLETKLETNLDTGAPAENAPETPESGKNEGEADDGTASGNADEKTPEGRDD